MDNQLKDSLNTEFETIGGIDSLLCILGLRFNDSVSPFVKSFLTLAHLMASARDFVLKGEEVPLSVCTWIKLLTDIVYAARENQK